MKRAVAALGCVALAIWVLFFANRSARQVGQLTLTPPGGPPVALTLWAADPLVELPFTTDTKWVQCGGKRWRLHGRSFGNAAGPVAVSPDLSQAVVHSSFEGGEFPAVVIDVRSGDMQRANRWSDYAGQEWTMRRWHTALEPLTDDELMRELRSGDQARFRAACDELERRTFVNAHWTMYATAALDPNLSKHQRRYLPYLLYHGDDVRYGAQMTGIFAKTADSDPQVRLFAAWALCELAQVEPGREFDLLAVWRRGPDAADAEVKAVRAWWVSNAKPEYWEGATASSTTQPVQLPVGVPGQ
ncbi:MAG TPA: hypothetical protein VGR35_23550 [Tepidisphaeraceae bacterium]|nr:hypothetical protein [Tepidisphaeraceae bacterium]